jgi:hypothetical protein
VLATGRCTHDYPLTSAGLSTEPDNNLSELTLSGEDLRALPDEPNQLPQILRLMAGGTGKISVYVDGFPQSGRIPPKAAIQMIRINSNPFAAEFSEPGRSRIEITTKPGSDKLHGEFAFNFNDESLNARNAFAPSRAPLQTRNFSGFLNGPIIRLLDDAKRPGEQAAVSQWQANFGRAIEVNHLPGFTKGMVTIIVREPTPLADLPAHKLRLIREEITALIPSEATFILVNDNNWNADDTVPGRQAWPFLE